MKNENEILIMGIPRSGTTLSCNLINQMPNCVALSEPMKFVKFKELNINQRLQYIDDFLNNTRLSLINNGIAVSKNKNGSIPDNPCEVNENSIELRKSKMQLGVIRVEKDLSHDFTLVIKHNAGFIAQLDYLSFHYRCFGIIRNPLSVLASWSTVNMPVHHGYSPIAELFDKELNNKLSELEDSLDRQIYLMNWFFIKINKYLSWQNIIKYEEVISSGGSCLNRIIPFANIHSKSLDNINNNFKIDKPMLKHIYVKLIQNSESYSGFYPISDIKTKYDELLKLV